MNNAQNQALVSGGDPAIQGEIVVHESAYPLLDSQQAMQQMLRVIDDNLGGEKFDIMQIPRIRATKDGIFQVDDAEAPSGVDVQRELKGQVVDYRQARVYWGRPFSSAASKERPMCSSIDGFFSVPDGNPGGECAKCPLHEFRSARNPDGSEAPGQACRELRQMLFLLPGKMLPHRLDVQPTSLKYFHKYTMNLMYAGLSCWSVITKLTLEIGPTMSGMQVARIKFALDKRLTIDQSRRFEPYQERMRAALRPMIVDASAYESEDNSPDRNPDNVPF